MRIARAFLCVALALAAARTTQAQTLIPDKAPQASREGFWIGFGFGGGTAGVSCTMCPTDRFDGGTARVALGGTVNPNLKLGGEAHVWVNTEDEAVDESMGNVSGSAYWYPSRTGNFFLQGGVGASTYSSDDGTNVYEASGVGIILGAGYDIRLGRKFSLTPIFAYSTALSGTLLVNGQDTGFSVKPNFVSLSLSAVWH